MSDRKKRPLHRDGRGPRHALHRELRRGLGVHLGRGARDSRSRVASPPPCDSDGFPADEGLVCLLPPARMRSRQARARPTAPGCATTSPVWAAARAASRGRSRRCAAPSRSSSIPGTATNSTSAPSRAISATLVISCVMDLVTPRARQVIPYLLHLPSVLRPCR